MFPLNYETMSVDGELTVENLLAFLSVLHGELADNGDWENLTSQANLDLDILAAEADKRDVPSWEVT